MIALFFVTERMSLAKKVEAYAKEKGLISSNQNLSVFLVTDRPQVKRVGSELYPGDIVTTAVIPMHVADTYGEDEVWRRGMLGAVADWWLFSRCRFFILQPYSGFGRTAAAYSLRLNSTLDMDHPDDIGLKSMDVFNRVGAGLRALEQQ